jgi:uncharacterized membrane protein
MRRYLIAGLLVWVPLGITIWVLNALVSALDQTLLLLPEAWQPDRLLGFHIPGFGVVLSFVILLGTGVLAANFFGARLIAMWESLLARIPFVRSVYLSVKQVSDTVLSDQGTAFRKALLVEWPHPGSWTIAFQTGTPAAAVGGHLSGEYVSIYVPTTPNPTGGYFVIVPTSSVHELDMSVDEALKYIISMGVVAPHPPLDALPKRSAGPALSAASTDAAAAHPRN